MSQRNLVWIPGADAVALAALTFTRLREGSETRSSEEDPSEVTTRVPSSNSGSPRLDIQGWALRFNVTSHKSVEDHSKDSEFQESYTARLNGSAELGNPMPVPDMERSGSPASGQFPSLDF